MSDVGSRPALLTDLGGTCVSFVGDGLAAGAGTATRCESAVESLAAASCRRPDCWPVPATEGTSCNGDGNGAACTPEATQERPTVAPRSSLLLDDDNDGGSGSGNDDERRSPQLAATMPLPLAVAATRRLASRPHYGGLLYHHHFPTTASRMKRKVLCAAAASLASPDSLAHEGLGGGKIRVSEERVARQLQQLRLAGAGSSNVDASTFVGGGVCQLHSPVPFTPTVTAESAAPQCEGLPPAASGSQRTPDRRPGGSGGRSTSSLHPRLPKHRLYDARRVPLTSLQAARRTSCPSLAHSPPSLGQLPVAAAAIDAPPRWSPNNFGWSQIERAPATTDEMDATASCRAVILSPPLVVWQSDEKPCDKSPALIPVEPPSRPSSERRMLTLSAPDILSREGGRHGGSGGLLQPLSVERPPQQPTLQVPANEAERSSSPPPSALINPDEEGVCVVLTVTHCNVTAEAGDKPEAADQCMEH